MKIKMTKVNTANNVTLKIGTETAKTLLYNGEAVSASNTWEEGEVISVYFDGTNYQASNAQGGSNRKIDAYLYGDLRTLAVGKIYEENEAVKTVDKKLLRMSKEVMPMNLTDEVAVGDLKTIISGTYLGTYKAQKAISTYSNVVTYENGAYAIGNPAKQIITVDTSSKAAEIAEGAAIVVTVNGIAHTISITSEKTSAEIASELSSAIGNFNGWTKTYTTGSSSIILKNDAAGAYTISFSFSDPDETGIVVSNSISAGTTVLCQYDETNDSWSTVSLNDYATDSADIGETDATKMWQMIDATGLESYTVQNTIASELKDTYNTEQRYVKVTVRTSLYANASTAGTAFGTTYSDSGTNAWGTTDFINVEDSKSITIYTTLRDSSGRKNVVGGVFYTEARNSNSCALTNGAWVMPGNSWAAGWLTLNVPEGAKFFRICVGLGKMGTVYHLTKKNAVSEIVKPVYNIEDNVMPLFTGHAYDKGEVVTIYNGNVLRLLKPIKYINTTDSVIEGDIKASGNYTYKALQNINSYSASVVRSNNSYPYSEGSYAVGYPSIHTLTVSTSTVVAGDITLTIGGVSKAIAITDGESTADIVASIISTISGLVSYWNISSAEEVITLECKKTSSNAITIAFADTGNTGVSVSVAKVDGGTGIGYYNGSTWAATTTANMLADTTLYKKVSLEWLASNVCEPDNNGYTEDVFDITKERVGTNSTNGKTVVKKTATGFRCTCIQQDSSVGYLSIHGLTPGLYRISFDTESSGVIDVNTSRSGGYLRIRSATTTSATDLWSGCVAKAVGANISHISFDFRCTTSSVLYFVFMNNDLRTANSYIELSNIRIRRASSYQKELEDINKKIDSLNNNVKVPTSYTGSYTGKEIDLGKNKHYYSLRTAYMNVYGAQALAIYGRYMIRISSGSQTVANRATLYYLNDDETVSQIWSVPIDAQHGNSAQFGNIIAQGSTFPYLYVSSLAATPACYVYKITIDGQITEVQRINISGITSGRNMQCGDDGYLYYYSAGSVTKFPLPNISEQTVTYTAGDIIETYPTGYGGGSTGQGGIIYDGKLYCPLGGYAVTDRRLVVVDLLTHNLITQIVLDGIIPKAWEPEDIDVRNGELYIGCSQDNSGIKVINFIG